MKKILIILNIALMSVILFNQAAANICPVGSFANIENMSENWLQIEDDCEEDIIANSNDNLFHIAIEEKLSRTISPSKKGILSFVWQPPE